VNGGCASSAARTRELNAAYEILSDPAQRQAYDAELAAPKKPPAGKRMSHSAGNITKEVHLRLEEFLRGTRLEVRVNDAGNPDGAEIYELIVPPETAPGTRFKILRAESLSRSFVIVRAKTRPDFRFKARGSDLRCDLKINFQRAQQGGMESVRGVTGSYLRVQIPKKVARGEIIRLASEGLPKPRGGRGDLLVRIVYTPDVRIKRKE
jgi:curved DNA-binding protein